MKVNSEDPDQTPRSAASDLGLSCLPMPIFNKKVTRLVWVKQSLLNQHFNNALVCVKESSNVIQNLLVLHIQYHPALTTVNIAPV